MKHTVEYDGYIVGDKVWVWAHWIPLVAEVEVIGLELNQDLDGQWSIYYTVNIQAPNGEIDQHSYDSEELYNSKKEALEAAIKDQEGLVADWQKDTSKQETTLGWLKEQLKQEDKCC